MAARQERIDELLGVLRVAGTWVNAATLARRCGVSERSVRSYVAEINRRGLAVVESSSHGYRIVSGGEARVGEAEEADRATVVLSRLIVAGEPVSVFDLADEMGLSDSTIMNTVVPRLRRTVSEFGVTLVSHDFALELRGPESAMRKLIGHVATHNDYGYFASVEALEDMFPDYNIRSTMNHLVEICQESELFLNNYALNNLLMHLMVIIIRLRSGNSLGPGGSDDDEVRSADIVESLSNRDEIIRCVGRIQDFARDELGVEILREDYRQLVAYMALFTEEYSYSELTRERLVRLVGEGFFGDVVDVMEIMRDRYGLPEFEEEFVLQFALHAHNAWQRATYGVPCPNPIAGLIKQEYAAIYDMAVFFTHLFGRRRGVTFNEDEVGFIAYHLGAYLEEHRAEEPSFSCIVVFERYHDFADGFLRALEADFGSELDVVAILDQQTYAESGLVADLVLTTIGLEARQPHTVLVSPVLSRRGVGRIQDELDELARERQASQARELIRSFLRPELFLRNRPVEDAESCIRLMGAVCVAQGVATPEFVDDVLLRERISGTAFTELLAVPHAIDHYAERSFIAVLHNDAPIPWGEQRVSFVVMIGLAKRDMRRFQDVLDLVIDLFTSPERSVRVLGIDTFDEFVDALGGA